LDQLTAKGRAAGGESAATGWCAAALDRVAAEMLPRLERAPKMVAELQARVDRLEAVGREFRANLGHAIDVLVHDRSRERAHLDALRSRRAALVVVPGAGSWESVALADEEHRAEGIARDLTFQIETLQA